MRKITVEASSTYDIIIGSGLLNEAGRLCAEVMDIHSVAIVSDDRVYALYGEVLEKSLEAAGYKLEAMECFEKMADWAIYYDERPESAAYSSVVINRVAYAKEEDNEAKGLSKCARLLRGNFGARIWAPIRGSERFREAISRMIACAEAHTEEEDEE